jgi:hypothetical protein
MQQMDERICAPLGACSGGYVDFMITLYGTKNVANEQARANREILHHGGNDVALMLGTWKMICRSRMVGNTV